jgi:anti-anti-sigma factor
MMELRITSNDKIALFLVKGKIGWDNSRILDTQIHKMVEKGCSHIIFNLDEVTFLCSGGIGALVYNMKKVQETGGDILHRFRIRLHPIPFRHHRLQHHLQRTHLQILRGIRRQGTPAQGPGAEPFQLRIHLDQHRRTPVPGRRGEKRGLT